MRWPLQYGVGPAAGAEGQASASGGGGGGRRGGAGEEREAEGGGGGAASGGDGRHCGGGSGGGGGGGGGEDHSGGGGAGGHGSSGGGGGGGGGGSRWLVLLDAAKACSTAPPDLSAAPADFVVLSYYKIFGHPTGLGALVVRRGALALLARNKAYFGGGTVEVSVADQPYQVRRAGPAGFEDGTPPFTAAAAARHGFAFLRRLGGPPAVHRHATALARWLAAQLAALRHANGAPVCALYGRWCNAVPHRGGSGAASAVQPPSAAAATVAAGPRPAGGLPQRSSEPPPLPPSHGPTLAFNLLRPDGGFVGYGEVGRLAAMHGLHLRTGCFCNPGACAEWLGLSGQDLIAHH
ncbi:Molybdenum cofactor sulfurase, partial [Tetrabaena socialis]